MINHGNRQLYSTGEISSICNVTKRAVRYYDQNGIIKAAYVDENNGYRYYDSSTLKLVQEVKYLQEIGSSIEEIREILLNMNTEKLKDHVQTKIMQLEKTIEEAAKKCEALKSWYCQFVEGKKSRLYNYSNNITVEYLPANIYVYVRSDSDFMNYDERVKMEAQLFASCNREGHTMCEIIGELRYFFDSADGRASGTADRLTVAQIIQGEIEDYPNTMIYGGTMAVCGYHMGNYDTIGKTYERLFDWGKMHNLVFRGDSMESQIVEQYMTSDPDEFVTKIHLPIIEDGEDERRLTEWKTSK